jgi:hypothetical protein
MDRLGERRFRQSSTHALHQWTRCRYRVGLYRARVRFLALTCADKGAKDRCVQPCAGTWAWRLLDDRVAMRLNSIRYHVDSHMAYLISAAPHWRRIAAQVLGLLNLETKKPPYHFGEAAFPISQLKAYEGVFK